MIFGKRKYNVVFFVLFREHKNGKLCFVSTVGKAIAPFYACRKTGENTKSSHSNVQASYWPALKSVNNSSSITTQPISSQSEDFRTVYSTLYSLLVQFHTIRCQDASAFCHTVWEPQKVQIFVRASSPCQLYIDFNFVIW